MKECVRLFARMLGLAVVLLAVAGAPALAQPARQDTTSQQDPASRPGGKCVHGDRVNGKCVCEKGWSGETCATPQAVTRPGGKCVHGSPANGRCVCEKGWGGKNCAVRATAKKKP